MNEWEFTALAASWMDQAIKTNPRLPFAQARCEQTGRGSRKRRDLTLLDEHGKPLLTGEVKMPFQPEGASPYRQSVVADARSKAERAKVEYFITWNVNRCVLWPTRPDPKAEIDRNYRSWDIVDVHKPEQMKLSAVEDRIRRWIPLFLSAAAQVLRGMDLIGRQSPDARFIDGLEAALEQPILLTVDALSGLYRRSGPRTEIQKWMREDQGWVVYDESDPDGTRQNISQAAQFANYSLVNRIVFHEALLKRFGGELARLDVPRHIDTGEKLRGHLEGFFEDAKRITRDYETVFGDEVSRRSVGYRIPFYADPAVAYWRELVEQIHEFDFSRLDYEVIGAIFERLISPEERHKYGQYYTRAEVVDLINSFCIRRGDERVMDPACGGGTFLVRAYARKRELDPSRDHSQRLRDLYGVDVSQFATHLTTINLATRDLIDDQNYPQVAREDFFNVNPGAVLMNLPARITAGGLGSAQRRDVIIPPLDAIVGNPPYVRQEGIPSSKSKQIQPGTKEFYKGVAEERAANIKLSGRSDLHVYFWLHAADFLHHGGWLGLLTSSQWLDVDYGFRLQEYILRTFEIHAIFESLDEPWFVGARVATCATLLRRQRDEAARMNQPVRFVQLRRPIAEILEHDGTTSGAIIAADRFRDEILSQKNDVVNALYRLRIVRQGELWNDGVRLGKVLGKSSTSPAKDPNRQQGDYYGGKWGMHLRAPDLWFELTKQYGDRFVPLGEIAEIRFGVKSGKDAFFFPIDVSDDALEAEPQDARFRTAYGVPRKEVESGRVKLVKCGEGRGEVRPIEAEHLEPEIHSLMEIDGFTVGPERCRRMILLTGKPTEELPKYTRTYIEWGEANDWHAGSTCGARGTSTRAWHDLSGHKRGAMFWPMQQQYKHAIPRNDNHLICNHNLFDVNAGNGEHDALCGILNSSLTVLAKYQYGRPVGVEGNLKTEVVDVAMMLVPDLCKARAADRNRVAAAFDAMRERKALGFVSERRLKRMKYTQKGQEDQLNELSDRTELDMPDRRNLDDAVLRLLGVNPPSERNRILDALYAYLRQHFEWVRLKEERAMVNKKNARRKGPASPGTLAAGIVDQIKSEHPELLRKYPHHFFKLEELFDTYDLSSDGEPQLLDDLIHGHSVRFLKGRRRTGDDAVANSSEQAALVYLLAKAGIRGFVRVPHEPTMCERVREKFSRWFDERQRILEGLVEKQTSDPGLQEKIHAAIAPLLLMQ